jgi:hypothetical protein
MVSDHSMMAASALIRWAWRVSKSGSMVALSLRVTAGLGHPLPVAPEEVGEGAVD